jgi:hypothetical protein
VLSAISVIRLRFEQFREDLFAVAADRRDERVRSLGIERRSDRTWRLTMRVSGCSLGLVSNGVRIDRF